MLKNYYCNTWKFELNISRRNQEHWATHWEKRKEVFPLKNQSDKNVSVLGGDSAPTMSTADPSPWSSVWTSSSVWTLLWLTPAHRYKQSFWGSFENAVKTSLDLGEL